ncbi:MAG: hydrogenase maturation protease [Candidatus Heimdallarchaeaceae archaeon]
MSPPQSFFSKENLSKSLIFCYGNRDRADDAFGLLVADELKKIHLFSVFSEEEKDISEFLSELLEDKSKKTVIIVDAIDFGAEPGTILMTSKLNNKLRPITSHNIPLEQIKEIVNYKGKEFVFIGSQVEKIDFLEEPSYQIKQAVKKVVELLAD